MLSIETITIERVSRNYHIFRVIVMIDRYSLTSIVTIDICYELYLEILNNENS